MIKLALPALFVSILAVPTDCNKKSQSKIEIETKTEILVKHVWQVDEIRRSMDGENTYYIKGGRNTTGVNYDVMQIRFSADGTGTYTDEYKIVHQTNWKFHSGNERNIEFKVGEPYAMTYQWNLVEITNTALHNTTSVGNNILLSARFVPVQ